MKLKVYAVVALVLLCSLATNAQKKRLNWQDPAENFYDTQKRLGKYFRKHEREERRERLERAREGKAQPGQYQEEELAGYELYKRWEYYTEPRVYPSGDKSLVHQAVENMNEWREQQAQNKQGGSNAVQSTTWQPLGPFGDPTSGNAGRINSVRFDPANASGLWACAPDGGLWKSTDNGGTWTTNTDNLSPLGCSDVVFDPTNSQIMYLATGDGDAGDTYSVGILKSTDGGLTWNSTTPTWATSQNRRIYKLLINPLNQNVLFAATNIGLLRTTNAGGTWSVVQSGAFTDIEYKPGDTTTVYAVSTSLYGGGTSFYKSSNGGSTFSAITSGLPASTACYRFAIAVTAANSAYVYLLACNTTNYGFYAFYRSTNSGTSFTSMATSPNLLGWSSTGNDAASGGQGWYDLSIAASPSNANEVIVGGVNIWRTTNGGTNWSLFAHWTGSGAPYVHADIHWLEYKNGSTIYVGCDGGVFYTSNGGASFAAINGAMNIAQMYKMGNSASTYSLAIAGHQDNGTNLYTGGWNRVIGGDGMGAFIDWNNNSVMYGELYYGDFRRSTNSGSSWTTITTGLAGTAAWNTPWHQDPQTANTLYGGYQQMFKSTNQGTNWSQIGSITGTSTITEFAVAPSNPQVIYVIKGGTALYKTTDGGGSWTNVTGTLPVSSARITWVAVDNTDANSAWVTFSGYSSGNKVFSTTDGGTSWTNYSTGLPNIPVNCITYWNNSNDGVYIGCDAGGLYFRDASMASWVAYDAGLPNVTITDLAIYYPLGKLRAATYGRGMWEVDLYNTGNMAPIANFSADKTNICAGMTVNFSDLSTFAPTGWSWIFQGGTPATSTSQNPSVTYNTAGTYSVQLTATNGNGSDAEIKTAYITVSSVGALPLVEGFQNTTFAPANWENYDDKNDNLRWLRSATVGKGSTASAYYDNYNNDASGSRDELRTPKYNFSGYSTIKMYFDVAYAVFSTAYPQYYDTLALMVSTDCGVTWTQAYSKGGPTLATTTTTYSTAIFVPTSAQWRTDTVYLNTYAGQSNVMVAFQNRGRYGQALYIDNVNISGTAGVVPVASFSVQPGPYCTGSPIAFTDQSTNSPTAWSWTFTGGTPSTSTLQNPTVTYAAAGTYTVTLVASNSFGSSAPATQTISITATPTLAAVASPSVICAGQSSVLTATGATSYTWSPGGATISTVSVSPATTTVYTVTGANGGCTATRTVQVNVTPSPTVTVNSPTICAGSTATLTASGATSYVWSTGSTASSITVTPSATTSYTVTGTTSGCSSAATSTVTVTPLPTVTVNSATICAGSTATLTASGATTYSWNTGSTSSSINVTPVATTVYTVTGTTSGCSSASTATASVVPNPTVTASSATVCSGASATLTATGATSYSWSTGATGPGISVSPASTTVYTVSGTTNGCSSVATGTVTVNPTPTISVNSASICSGNTATLTASGAASYSWSPGTGLSATTGSVVTASPSSTTVYTVTGTTSGCSGSSTSTVSVVSSLTVTVNSATICAGSSAALSAGGASTYTWSTGAIASTITVSPTSTSVYTVTGSSGSCSSSNTSTVTVVALPVVTASTSATTICSGQSVTLTGSGASTYTWSANAGSATTSTVSVAPSSTQTFTVTGSASGCNNSATVSVTVTPTPTVTVNSATICPGGTATLTASGASTYTWSPGTGLSGTSGSTVFASPSSTLVYTVVGAASGCSATNTSTVTVSPTPTVTANSAVICAGASATLTASGASSYTWNPGGISGSTVMVSPSSSTTYTVTGSNGACTGTATSNVTVNNLPNISASAVQDTICIGGSTGVSANGGSTYSWAPPSGLSATTGSNVVASPTVTTTYTVTGVDANNCSNTATVLINVEGCTGASAVMAASGLRVYPNPNNGAFTIEFPAGGASQFEVEIRNVLSQLVLAESIVTNGQTARKAMKLPEGTKGVLSVQISSSLGSFVYRIVSE